MKDQAVTKQEQKCRHHWQCSQPIDGVVYQRCKLCKDTLAVDAHAEGVVDLHPAQVGGPQSPWWPAMNNREKHEWYLRHHNQIKADAREYGREGARKLWGIASDATLHSLLSDTGAGEPAKAAIELDTGFGHMSLEELRMLPKRAKKALAVEAGERGINTVADEKGIPRQLLSSWCAAYSPKRAVAGILLELPPPGTPLSEERKEGLRAHFSALVDSLYPEAEGASARSWQRERVTGIP